MVLVAACGDEPVRPVASPVDVATLVRAQAVCREGDVAAGLAALDSVVAATPTAEALVARALCRWVEFHSTGRTEVGEAVEADLTSALAQARVADADEATLARIYSHRAALRRSLGPGKWPATLADLNAAIEADTSRALYVFDRAVARIRHGDSAGAVRDLERYLRLDTLSGARGDLARQLRDDIRPRVATP